MTNPNDAAFARPIGDSVQEGWSLEQEGLTKREYAAIHIVATLCSAGVRPVDYESLSRKACEMADKLFQELNK